MGAVEQVWEGVQAEKEQRLTEFQATVSCSVHRSTRRLAVCTKLTPHLLLPRVFFQDVKTVPFRFK